jgi:hypothetical protein
MVIRNGNFFRLGDVTGPRPTPYALTEDTVVIGGMFILCRVTNVKNLTVLGADQGDKGGLFDLDIQGGNIRGLYINGVKQDAFVYQVLEPWDRAVALDNEMNKTGREGKTAIIWAVDFVRTGSPTMTLQDFIDAYEANDFYVGSGKLINEFKNVFQGASWAEVRDVIQASSKARLLKEPTEVIGEFS